MTNLDTRPTTSQHEDRAPDRRVLVMLAVLFLAGFVAMMIIGTDREPDADPGRIIADYDTSLGVMRIQSYFLMTVCGVMVFLGAGIRSALAPRTRSWTADAALAGFVILALTYAGFGVTGAAMHHAVDIGDPTLVAAVNLLDTSNFLPAMAGMICLYVGTGVTALREQALPSWLSWLSIALGVAAPLGPLGFAPFMLLPVWAVLVAALLRRDAPV